MALLGLQRGYEEAAVDYGLVRSQPNQEIREDRPVSGAFVASARAHESGSI